MVFMESLQGLSLDGIDHAALRKAIAEKSLYEFCKQAWHVVEPTTPFVPSWHIEAICEHLEAVSRGKIKRLLINMPPRHMKSLIIAVFWPCWEWTWNPSVRWLFSSYAEKLSVRDSLKCRRILLSDWYQSNWGDVVKLTGDQNMKGRFENSSTGYRVATSVGAAVTGEGGDRVVVDDPHNVKYAHSKTVREGVLTWWDEGMSTRLNNPENGALVIVMQRLHELDLSGHVLEKGNYDHLCFPAEFEAKNKKAPTAIGWEDPRTEDGELLCPERFTKEGLENFKRDLGPTAYAGQFQQRPAPAEGSIIKREWLNDYRASPIYSMTVQSWDTAFKKKATSDWSCGQHWGMNANGYFLEDLIRDKMEYPELKRAIINFYNKYKPNVVLIEDAASGQSVGQELKSTTRIPIILIKPTDSKIVRTQLMTPTFEAGKVYVKDGQEWNHDFVEECLTFPNASHDDQVDPMIMALNYMKDNFGVEAMVDWMEKEMAGDNRNIIPGVSDDELWENITNGFI